MFAVNRYYVGDISKKSLYVLLTVVMFSCLIAAVPQIARAADEVCEIIETGIQYADLGDALGEAQDKQTIRLLDNITYNNGISIVGKTITFDVQTFSLNIVNPLGHGLEVGNSGALLLDDKAGGKLNVSSTLTMGYGVRAYSGATVTVSQASGGWQGIHATGASLVSVKGDAIASDTYAGNAGVYASGATVIVNGITEGSAYGVQAMGAAIVTAGSVKGGIYGVHAGSNAKVSVTGHVNASGGDGVYATGATVDIIGSVLAPNGYGVYCAKEAAITVTADNGAGSYAIQAKHGVAAWESGAVTINGNIIASASAVSASNSDTLTVNGHITGGYDNQNTGYCVVGGGGQVIINGHIKTGGNAVFASKATMMINGDIEACGMGVSATEDAVISIEGNITVQDDGTWAIGLMAVEADADITGDIIVSASSDCDSLYGLACVMGGTINMLGHINVILPEPFSADNGIAGIFCVGGVLEITGDISVTGRAAIGAFMNDDCQATLNGVIEAGIYINLNGTEYTKNDITIPSTKAGYCTYSDGGATVWVSDESVYSAIIGAVLYHNSKTPAKIELYDSEDNLFTFTATNDKGAFTLAVPAGIYSKLVVSKAGYLKYTLINITVTENIDLGIIDFLHMAGDINGDGVVNAEDLTCLLSEFNKTPSQFKAADIDGSGIVNAVDLTYLLAGFNKIDIIEIYSH